jgi:nitrite reductase/ring-hydroxylating ferredoxin subunit
MSAPHDTTHTGGDCVFSSDRRTFLRASALGVLAALVGDAALPALAEAVGAMAPRTARGAELRYTIPASDSVAVDERNELILVRWQGRAYALSTKCTHRGATLEWRGPEGRVFCPKHKARFRPDGAHDSGRSARALDRYDIRREGGSLVIRLDALRRADTDPAGWASAVAVVLG